MKPRVDNSGMPIGSCRPRLGLIDRSELPYSLSQGVYPCPKQNTRRILHMEDRHIFGVKQKSLHPEKLNEQFART